MQSAAISPTKPEYFVEEKNPEAIRARQLSLESGAEHNRFTGECPTCGLFRRASTMSE